MNRVTGSYEKAVAAVTQAANNLVANTQKLAAETREKIGKLGVEILSRMPTPPPPETPDEVSFVESLADEQPTPQGTVGAAIGVLYGMGSLALIFIFKRGNRAA